MESGDTNPLRQASAIPFRVRDGRLEFCQITSIKRGHWGFPKGIIDPGETSEETALKEAEEEAGLSGRLVGEPLGEYEYSKWASTLRVIVYLMEVTATADDWDEAELRTRAWRAPEEARAALARSELRSLLDAAIERIRSEAG